MRVCRVLRGQTGSAWTAMSESKQNTLRCTIRDGHIMDPDRDLTDLVCHSFDRMDRQPRRLRQEECRRRLCWACVSSCSSLQPPSLPSSLRSLFRVSHFLLFFLSIPSTDSISDIIAKRKQKFLNKMSGLRIIIVFSCLL